MGVEMRPAKALGGVRVDRLARLLRGTVALVAMLSLNGPGLALGQEQLTLPPPHLEGRMSLEAAMHARHSVREFKKQPVSLEGISQLLWAAQGITRDQKFRTAPSAGALYPLEVYAVTAERTLHYLPPGHRAEQVSDTDLRPALAKGALSQPSVEHAPLLIVITGVEARTRGKYGDKAPRYVDREAGHAAENVLLEATALGLGAVPIGAFEEPAVAKVLQLKSGESPLYIIPVGYPAQ